MSETELIIANKNYSSWSLRAWLHLKKSGIPFTETRIPLYTEEWDRRIGDLSPSGRLPAMRHEGITVWDSMAIIEYAMEYHPEGVGWPEDPRARALARAVSAEMHSGFFALREELPLNCRARYEDLCFSEEAMADIGRIREIWSECRQRFKSAGPWLFGAFSVADVMYAPVASRFRTYSIGLEPVEREYVDTLMDLPEMRGWMREAEEEPESLPAFDK